MLIYHVAAGIYGSRVCSSLSRSKKLDVQLIFGYWTWTPPQELLSRPTSKQSGNSS